MKNDIITSDLIDEETLLSAIQKLFEMEEDRFSDISEILRFSKDKDFKFANLRGVDFSYADLRGYSFYGADLRESFGVDVKFDNTTDLRFADVTGSLFAKFCRERDLFKRESRANKFYTIMQKGDFGEVTRWLGQRYVDRLDSHRVLRDMDDDAARILCQKLLTDEIDLTKRTSLFFFLRDFTKNREALREIVLEILAIHLERTDVVRSFVKVASQMFMKDEVISNSIWRLCVDERESVRETCFVSLSESDYFYSNIERFREIVFSENNLNIRRKFIREAAIRLGKQHIQSINFDAKRENVSLNSVLDWGDLNVKDNCLSIGRMMAKRDSLLKKGMGYSESKLIAESVSQDRINFSADEAFRCHHEIRAHARVLERFFMADDADKYAEIRARVFMRRRRIEEQLDARIRQGLRGSWGR